MLAIGLLGPGLPLLETITGQDGERSRRRSTVAAAGGDGGLEFFSGEAGWTATVRVDGPIRDVVLPKAPPASKRTALIVGINRARGGRPLPGSIADATNLRDALLGYGFKRKNITMLIEDQASAARIRDGLERLAHRTPADGLAVFAVATHTRRRGGQNEFLTADGLRISASELGAALGKVRAKMWVALPTCFAGGYAVPGIVGKNRIATFASSSTQPTYQLGNAGSYLFIHMVRKAMLEGKATGSVEQSFGFAESTLRRESPDRVPTMSDGVKGDLVLGEMSDVVVSRFRATRDERTNGGKGDGDVTFAKGAEQPQPSADPVPTPEPQSAGQRRGIRVCGKLDYRCGNPSPTPS